MSFVPTYMCNLSRGYPPNNRHIHTNTLVCTHMHAHSALRLYIMSSFSLSMLIIIYTLMPCLNALIEIYASYLHKQLPWSLTTSFFANKLNY